MHFECYQDKKGLWRWRLVARNGRIMADSGEGYATQGSLSRALKTLKTKAKRIPQMEIVWVA